jgi:hypothetical protein
MTNKIEIEAALFASLTKTARFRDSVAQRFPSDPRNATAVFLLRRMTQQVSLSDEQCAAIAPHFDRSERWSTVLTEAGRGVGFRPGLNDFQSYASNLIEALAR